MRSFKNLIVLALLAGTNFSFAQLTGTAFLSSQSNHSGIKVKFKANPGTAVTDSTLTDAAGNYSINITGGNYNVTLSKIGYQPVDYNSGQAVILTNTTSMNSVTLTAGNVVNVSGSVSGTWVNTNIYLVTADATIPSGSTLTINPGTVVKFNGNYSLTAIGVLNAQGNDPNSEILFTSNLSPSSFGDWRGVYIYNNFSKIKYCAFEWAFIGLFVSNSSMEISYNRFLRTYHAGLYIQICSSHVHNNLFEDFHGPVYSAGIEAESCNALIECNEIHDGEGKGIWDMNSGIIRNNVIYNITNPQRGYGVLSELPGAGGTNTTIIQNNIIHDCIRTGLEVSNNITGLPETKHINNTIFNCGSGIYFHETTKVTVVNNVIFNNTYAGIRQYGSNAFEISYNDVWNNGTNYFDVQNLGIGQNVTTNGNGDPVDSYFNFSKDPLFSNGQPPYLSSSSPCLNVGKVMYSTTIGANTNSFCSGMEIGVREQEQEIVSQVFPNPFNEHFTIKINAEKVNLKIFDLLGKEIPVSILSATSSEANLSIGGVAPGIYFLQISSGNSKETVKLIKN